MTADKKPRFFYGYVVISVACLIMAVIQGTYFSFGVFLKPLTEDFGWTRAITAGAFGVNTVLHGVLFIVAGKLNDRFGPRILVTACGFLMGLGYLLMSQIGAIWQLYFYYGVLVAMGISGGFVPMISTASRWFVKRRGLASGIVAAGVGLGTLVMPPLSNWLITNYDWRNSYMIIGIASMVTLILIAQFLKRDPSEVGQLPDGESELEASVPSSKPLGLSLRQAIKTTRLWVFCLICFSWAFGVFSMSIHIVPHATDLGVTPATAASILGIIGGAGFAGRIIVGAVADRVGTRPAYMVSLLLLAGAFSLLVIASEVWAFYLFGVMLGIGFGGVVAMYGSMIADLFGLNSHGVILGLAVSCDALGAAVGSVVAGEIFDVTTSYLLHIWICLALSLLALILVFILTPALKRGNNIEPK